METKKSDKVNLEKSRLIFIEIGLAVALIVTFGAFEYSTVEKKFEKVTETKVIQDETELIPVTRQDIQAPPPPPKETVSNVIEILNDDVKVNDELSLNSEIDENTSVNIEAPTPIEMKDEETEEPTVFFIVEDMPEFPGGELALRKYIAENVRYPEMAKENEIQGTVYVRFVVNEKGAVTNVEVLRGVDPLLDAEAIRVVKSLPNFKPGKQRGKAVKVSHSVPIKFALQS